jgi:hypothetical protein
MSAQAFPRALELDGPEDARIDPRSIIVAPAVHQLVALPSPVEQDPGIVWQGDVDGDGSGRKPSYYVRLYADGGGHCACPDYYFRGLLRRQTKFRCKHLVRAWAVASPSSNSMTRGG